MSNSSDIYIYVPDTEELTHFFEEWPDKIGLALINGGDDTDTDTRIFHIEERDQVFAEIAESFGLLPEDLKVVPEIEGYDTIGIKFSEEQRLIALIEEMTALEDEAHDHLGNYEFYREQGLDTDTLHDHRDIPLQASEDRLQPEEPVRPARAVSDWSRPGNDHGCTAVYSGSRVVRNGTTITLYVDPNANEPGGLSISIGNEVDSVQFDEALSAFRFTLPSADPDANPHPSGLGFVYFMFGPDVISEDLRDLLAGDHGRNAQVVRSGDEVIVTLLDYVAAPDVEVTPETPNMRSNLSKRDWVLGGAGLLSCIAFVTSIALLVSMPSMDVSGSAGHASTDGTEATGTERDEVQLDRSYLDELEQRIFSQIEERTESTSDSPSR